MRGSTASRSRSRCASDRLSLRPFLRHSIWNSPVSGPGESGPCSGPTRQRRTSADFVSCVPSFDLSLDGLHDLRNRISLDEGCLTSAASAPFASLSAPEHFVGLHRETMEEPPPEVAPHSGPHRTARDDGPRTRLDAAQGPLPIPTDS